MNETAPAAGIVRGGPYRFGRNPMYPGMSAVYWGVALWMTSVWAVILFPIVIVLLVRFVIRRAERFLESAFGEDHLSYRAAVGRWLSL